MAQGPGWVPHLPAFQEQGLQREDPPETTPIYNPEQKAYKCYWHKGTPLYPRTGIHVHLVHHLSIPGMLGLYEVVGDGWQLKVINAHVPIGDATEPFLQALAEAYRQMAILAPKIIIGDMKAAPTPADRGGKATPQDHAVCNTIEMLGLVDFDSEPRRPTIPPPPPNRSRPLPHQRMLWRPHHHHPGEGPIWTPSAGTPRP